MYLLKIEKTKPQGNKSRVLKGGNWRTKRQRNPVFLPGESHGQRSLPGYSPWSSTESDTIEQLTLRFVIAFHPRNKHFLISWLQSPSVMILEQKKIKSVTVSIVFPSVYHEAI